MHIFQIEWPYKAGNKLGFGKGNKMMLDAGSKIIDHIIDLLHQRERNGGRPFEDFVQPLFVDMILSHQDYIRKFMDLIQEIDDLKSEDQIHIALLRRKSELEPSRLKVHSFLKEARKSKVLPKSANCFFNACVQYFMMRSGQVEDRDRHGYANLVAFLAGEEMSNIFHNDVLMENKHPAPNCSTEIVKLLLLFLGGLKNRWSVVTSQYAFCRYNLSTD